MAKQLFTNLLDQLRRTAATAESAGLEDAQLLERFLANRDEAAFALLLRRHGPMVLGVCRRVLANSHDCEDAFQATFLVLLKKAGSLRRRELLANWLYGVAHRTALKARSQSARRHSRQQELTREPTENDSESIGLDLGCALDEEVNRLPAKYRSPVILCYFEGKTLAEAAVQLSWPVGTVSGRLARARVLLKKRLSRRDITPVTSWEGLILQAAGPVQVPAVLITSTLRLASGLAAGSAAGATVISGPVAMLTEGVLKAMFMTKIKILTIVAAIGVLAAGSGVIVSANMRNQSVSSRAVQQPSRVESSELEGSARSPNQQPQGDQRKIVSPFDNEAAKKAFFEQMDKARTDLSNSPSFLGLGEVQAKTMLQNSGQAENLKPILQALFEAANVEAQARWAQYFAGQGTLDLLSSTSIRLLDAERLLSKRTEDQLAALEHHLKRMKEIEKINQSRFEAARIQVADLAQTRFFRIQAQLWLEQAKAK
jgi:RNA polymerase sigma factor (sigma-70 family)